MSCKCNKDSHLIGVTIDEINGSLKTLEWRNCSNCKTTILKVRDFEKGDKPWHQKHVVKENKFTAIYTFDTVKKECEK